MDRSYSMDIGERIKSERELLGWSQNRLAKESGMTQSQLSFYESGKRVMYLESARKVCDALGVSIDWLVRGGS